MIHSLTHTSGKQLYVNCCLEISIVCLGSCGCKSNCFVSKKMILFDKKTNFVCDGQLWLVKQPLLSAMGSYG